MPDPIVDRWWATTARWAERIGWLVITVASVVASQYVAPIVNPPAEVVRDEPALVIVTDAKGVRITDAAVETVAGKLAVGTWQVQAIPQPGETGWSRSIVVSDGVGPVPPVPVPPTPPIIVPPPVPPEPTPPPVVSGKRALLIVRETAETTPELGRLIVGLRTGQHAAYLSSKGHTLSILDDDAKDEAGQPAAIVTAWQPFFRDLQLPALLIIDPATSQLVHREALGPAATADSIVATLKGHGG